MNRVRSTLQVSGVIVGMAGGWVLGSGCLMGESCSCPRTPAADPFRVDIVRGQHEVVDVLVTDDGETPRSELEGASVTVDEDFVEILYALPDESQWRVTYRVAHRGFQWR